MDGEPVAAGAMLASDLYPVGHKLHQAACRFDAIPCPRRCSCKSKLSIPDVVPIMDKFRKLPQGERVLVASTLILSNCRFPNILDGASRSAKRPRPDGHGPDVTRQRIDSNFQLLGNPVCRYVALGFFGVGKSNYQARVSDFKCGKFALKGNMKRGFCSKGKKHPRTKSALLFLDDYGRRYGLPVPSGRGSRPDQPLQLLPVGTLHKDVASEYVKWLESAFPDERPLSSSAFRRVWREQVPQLRVMQKRTDFCDLCTSLRALGSNFRDALLSHRQDAAAEHEFQLGKLLLSQKYPSEMRVVLFDFAQHVELPLFADQPKQFYFANGLRLNIFGVADHTNRQQTTFMLPEGHWPYGKKSGKNTNSVISMLHKFLHDRGLDNVPTLFLSADNCGGQNKNHVLIYYLSWRMSCFPHREIYLHFKVAGHTKMFCDACFGLVKRKLYSQAAHTPREAFEVAKSSGKCNDVFADASEVQWRNWTLFLQQFFAKRIPNFNSYHHFRFEQLHPGVVHVKKRHDSLETTFKLNTSPVPIDRSKIESKWDLPPTPIQPGRVDSVKKIVDTYFIGDLEHKAAEYMANCRFSQ